MSNALKKLWQVIKASGAIVLLCFACKLCFALPPNESELYSQDAVTAAYLYRIVNYVDWPDDDKAAQPFTIAVIGSDGVVDELERVLHTRTIKNTEAQVRKIKNLNEMGDAKVLYIGVNYQRELHQAILAFAKNPTLVVTNRQGGLESGATVNFLLIDQRVRFEVSLANAERAGLKISSALLSVAVRVQDNHSSSEISCDSADHERRNCISKAAP